MNYFEVLVASPKYHKSSPLTYSYDKSLVIGSVVVIPLQKDVVMGIVVDTTAKPAFKTASIIKTLPGYSLNKQTMELIDWLLQYYPSPSGIVTSLFISKYLAGSKNTVPLGSSEFKTKKLPPLKSQQKQALAKLESSKAALLFGQTGSGKTRVYLELANKNVQNNRSVLILTPEIGLTAQLVSSFQDVFKERVRLFHSGLTDKERSVVWSDISTEKSPLVVIGTRSAMFLPFKSLGLVVVDESHDSSYKQEQLPRYDGRRVAAKLAQLYRSQIIYGTATPAITDYFVAENKGAKIVEMSGNAAGPDGELKISLVSSLDKARFSHHPYISDELISSIKSAINNDEQVLIFLNRRGTARIVVCANCGWQADCPKCDLPLTYHDDKHVFMCHTCGHAEKARSSCPSCHNTEIMYRQPGTKSLLTTLEKLFPQANIRRFDTDSKKTERLEQNFTDIKNGKVNILVGTQLLTKGLDLPKLSTVGVISADTSLGFPDYTAEEKTYQMVRQIIGRVARGHRDGKVIIQTYYPESFPILSAINNDWSSFYQKELAQRQQYLFPPFCYLLKLSCSRKTATSAESAANKLSKTIKMMKLPVELIGPNPSFYTKKGNLYNWQIVVKSKSRRYLLEIIKQLPSGWNYDIDPANLL